MVLSSSPSLVYSLLNFHAESTTEPTGVQHLIGFLSETPIQSIKRATDDYISSWFYDVRLPRPPSTPCTPSKRELRLTPHIKHTLVFVASDHHVWDPTRQRKLRKKYGNLRKSPQRGLNHMLTEHFEDVKSLLLQKKAEWEEEHGENASPVAADEDGVGGETLKSPPSVMLGGNNGVYGSGNGLGGSSRRGSGTGVEVRSPKLPPPPGPPGPQIGFFSAPSPGPRSPMKKSFGGA
jgi:histone deacetylase 6